MWRPDLDSSHAEARKIAHLIVPYTRGRGIDVGSGPHRLFDHWTTVDSGKDFGGRRVADMHMDGGCPLPLADHSLDFVFSSHFLEHVVDFERALASWWRFIKPGGHLVLYLPHADLYPRRGQPGANPDHKHDFLPEHIIDAMETITDGHDVYGADLIENETRADGDEYSFFQVYRKHSVPGVSLRERIWQRNPGGKKRALVARFGAFGDQLMASSILPHLQDQGYHVTYACTPRGEEVLRHDPHIDEFMLQDPDQMPAHALVHHIRRLGAERFDKVINLTGSLEQLNLLHPNDVGYWHDHETRVRLYDTNYLENTHRIAGVPVKEPRQKFYLSQAEWNVTRAFRADHPFAILISLSGSSVHKTYPHFGAVVRVLLRDTNATIVLTGDKDCQLLEQAICQQAFDDDTLGDKPQAELQLMVTNRIGKPRLLLRSGDWSIREAMAHATVCDLVVGPETGLMHAVAFEEKVGKVVLMSHSSVNNLTRDWPNTTSLRPERTPCYPCHRLHYGFENCHRDEDTGAALCAANIHPKRVLEALHALMAPHINQAAE